MPKNLGYNIGTTNLGLRCTIKFHLGFKEQFLIFPLLVVFCNNFCLPKRLTKLSGLNNYQKLKKYNILVFWKKKFFIQDTLKEKIGFNKIKKILWLFENKSIIVVNSTTSFRMIKLLFSHQQDIFHRQYILFILIMLGIKRV